MAQSKGYFIGEVTLPTASLTSDEFISWVKTSMVFHQLVGSASLNDASVVLRYVADSHPPRVPGATFNPLSTNTKH